MVGVCGRRKSRFNAFGKLNIFWSVFSHAVVIFTSIFYTIVKHFVQSMLKIAFQFLVIMWRVGQVARHALSQKVYMESDAAS